MEYELRLVSNYGYHHVSTFQIRWLRTLPKLACDKAIGGLRMVAGPSTSVPLVLAPTLVRGPEQMSVPPRMAKP